MGDRGVVVVGGGPVGVGLALDLGQRGVPVTILERRTQLAHIPKGQGLSQRTMEHFWRWGLADELRAARTMPPDYPIGQLTAYDNLMGEYWFARPARELVQGFYYQANERLPQYRTEEVLREAIAGMPHVQLRTGVRVVRVEQDDTSASAVVEANGEEQRITGDYLVGCDGGHSVVRDGSGIERAGTDWDQLVVLIVFRSKEFHEALNRFPERSTYRVLHPDLKGYWMFFGRVDVGEEFFFHAPVPREAADGDYDFAGLLHRAAGMPFACEIDHVGFWDLRVQVAREYQVGRIFVAGDAAHTHPPYGGFGLNNGLEDAVNLSWKLAAVRAGWGGEGLLETYTIERQPVFEEVGEDIIGGWIRDDADFLATWSAADDPEAFRRRFDEVTRGFGKRLLDFEPNYEGSPIVAGPPAGVVSAHGEHSVRARAGHHLTPVLLASGRNVYEELGEGFTLIAAGAADAAVTSFEVAARDLGVPLTVCRDAPDGGGVAFGEPLVLVRPDQFVAWTGGEPVPDARAILCRAVGAASATTWQRAD